MVNSRDVTYVNFKKQAHGNVLTDRLQSYNFKIIPMALDNMYLDKTVAKIDM